MTSAHDAWAQGYAAAEADALHRPYSDHPSAATWKPTANPYPNPTFSPGVEAFMQRVEAEGTALAEKWSRDIEDVYSRMGPLPEKLFCDHPADLRAVLSGRLTCGQCGVILSG